MPPEPPVPPDAQSVVRACFCLSYTWVFHDRNLALSGTSSLEGLCRMIRIGAKPESIVHKGSKPQPGQIAKLFRWRLTSDANNSSVFCLDVIVFASVRIKLWTNMPSLVPRWIIQEKIRRRCPISILSSNRLVVCAMIDTVEFAPRCSYVVFYEVAFPI